MLMPSIFTNTYFNDFFEDPFKDWIITPLV